MPRTTPLLLWLLARLATSSPALAEPAPDRASARAERLFEQGLQEMRGHEYGVACPRLAESYQLDPSPGALFTLAECEAGWQKSASALAHYQSFVAALTTMTEERRETFEERRRIAAGQIAVLSVSAPKLTISVAPELPLELVVKSAGVVVPQGAYGVARRVDPGAYSITAELDGKAVWQRSVDLEAGNQALVEVTRPSVAASAAPASSPSPSDQPGTKKPIALYVAGGVAVAGLATGLVAGLLAYKQKSTIDSHCPDRTCDPQGRAALNSASSEARVSTVGVSFGIAGAATAAALLIFSTDRTAPRAKAASAQHRWGVASDGRTISLVTEF
jgi:hypothetical protein